MKQKTVSVSLTETELAILAIHWERNLSYGVGGSFGNGEKLDSEVDYETAQKIMTKLARKLNWSR